MKEQTHNFRKCSAQDTIKRSVVNLFPSAWQNNFRSKCGLISMGEIPFDLQLFAGEKTEPATEKRREEARQQGNVLKSQDLSSVLVLLLAFLAIRYFGTDILGTMGNFMRFTLSQALATELSLNNTTLLFSQFTLIGIKCLAPIFAIICISALIVNLGQIGVQISFDPLVPDINRLNPISGFENIVSWKSFGELIKSLFKILIVSYIPYSTISRNMPTLIRLIQLDPVPGMILFAKIIFSMIYKILALLFVLALGDWFFQYWRYEESLKMSKEEIKDEYKQREGDPKIKAKIRERQRKMATKRMMEEVPKATVVVTNPTHIAVAIQYDNQSSSSAPKVVAMGTGGIAQKIKEIAQEHEVPIIENKPLARALHDNVEVGDEIPADLWQAVAEILMEVYRLKQWAL